MKCYVSFSSPFKNPASDYNFSTVFNQRTCVVGTCIRHFQASVFDSVCCENFVRAGIQREFNTTSVNMAEEDEKVQIMRKAFQMFDTTKSGVIETLKIATILNTMGQMFDDTELNNLIADNDPDNTGKVNFDGFCNIAGHFLEEEDDEAMQQELKEAFRLYDREGNGYITTGILKEILAALDDKLTNTELDGIIAEIDTDGSGTVDFDEFMEMMTGD